MPWDWKLTRRSLLFGAEMALGALALWYGLRALGDENPQSAVVEWVLIFESGAGATWQSALWRGGNVLIGGLFGMLVIWIGLPEGPALALGIALAAAFCGVFRGEPGKWKVAPMTAVAVILEGGSGFHVAAGRMLPVLVAGIAAVIASWLFAKLRRPAPAIPQAESP